MLYDLMVTCLLSIGYKAIEMWMTLHMRVALVCIALRLKKPRRMNKFAGMVQYQYGDRIEDVQKSWYEIVTGFNL